MTTKQIIVIRKDLKMRRGKECAQASHASMAFLTKRAPEIYLKEVELEWLNSSFRKICCQVDSEEELLKVYEQAKENNLETHLITDSGLTEFGGAPTHTCIAIGPDYDNKIDSVTKNLKLY